MKNISSIGHKKSRLREQTTKKVDRTQIKIYLIIIIQNF